MKGHTLVLVTLAVALAAPVALAQQAPIPPPPPPPPFPRSEPPTFEAGTPTMSRAPLPPAPPVVLPPPDGPPPPIECTGPGTFTHDGLYLRLTTGFGGLGANVKGTGNTVSLSGAATGGALAIGGTPGRGFVVGGALRGLSVNQPSSPGLSGVSELSVGAIAAFVDWFPNERRGWHVGGMLGLGAASISRVGADTWSGVSFAGGAFGGYDFWIGPEWSLGVQGSLGFTTQAKLQDTSQNTSTGYTLGSFAGTIDLALLYH